jgi:putative transposase
MLNVENATHLDRNDWREDRRFLAWELAQNGWRQKDIAAKLGVTNSAVSQWLKRARENGSSGLQGKVATGAPPLLREEEFHELKEMLKKGALHYGYKGDNWSRKKVADLIYRQYGVVYSDRHAGRLLKKLGWT